MQPETTDKTTENTNVDEKKIISRKKISTTSSSGAYWYTFTGSETISYQKADNNTYTLDGYISLEQAGVIQNQVYPLNAKGLDTSTGKIVTESRASLSTIAEPGGNKLTVTYTINYKNVSSGWSWYVYRVLYTTRITESTIW